MNRSELVFAVAWFLVLLPFLARAEDRPVLIERADVARLVALVDSPATPGRSRDSHGIQVVLHTEGVQYTLYHITQDGSGKQCGRLTVYKRRDNTDEGNYRTFSDYDLDGVVDFGDNTSVLPRDDGETYERKDGRGIRYKSYYQLQYELAIQRALRVLAK